jgi:hypothetical protein
MVNISKSKARFVLFGTAAVLVIGIGTVAWKLNERRAHSVDQVLDTKGSQGSDSKTYLRPDELNAVSSTKEQMAGALERAFTDHRLYEAASWPVPKREGFHLVLATPTVSGKEEQFSCGGFYNYPYCGLYLTTATSSRLLTWGESLTGLQDIEDFPDAGHVQIGFAWSFMNFSSITHQLLDLQTGAMVPLMNVEIDLTDTSANMLVIAKGNILTLFVSGQRVSGGLSPQEIQLKDENDRVMYHMQKSEIDHLVTNVQKSVEKPGPLVLLPQKDDVMKDVLHVELFGIAYELDLKAKTLKPLVSFE